jgi:hypothetical protein
MSAGIHIAAALLLHYAKAAQSSNQIHPADGARNILIRLAEPALKDDFAVLHEQAPAY